MAHSIDNKPTVTKSHVESLKTLINTQPTLSPRLEWEAEIELDHEVYYLEEEKMRALSDLYTHVGEGRDMTEALKDFVEVNSLPSFDEWRIKNNK